jgi:hypothetical protein
VERARSTATAMSGLPGFVVLAVSATVFRGSPGLGREPARVSEGYCAIQRAPDGQIRPGGLSRKAVAMSSRCLQGRRRRRRDCRRTR